MIRLSLGYRPMTFSVAVYRAVASRAAYDRTVGPLMAEAVRLWRATLKKR